MEKMTFEDGMAKLEKLVRELERGELPLEASFEAYEEGTRLAKELKKILDEGDAKIRVLTEDGERDMNQ